MCLNQRCGPNSLPLSPTISSPWLVESRKPCSLPEPMALFALTRLVLDVGSFGRRLIVFATCPPTPFQVSVYLQCLILEASSPSPVLNAVYSIDWAQQLAGLPKVSVHPMVSAMVSASQRILGKDKSKKEPITPEMLRALVSSKISDKSPSLSDLRTVALCLIGYAGLFSFQ